ncbi:alpha/beta fold hydrolase [Sphingobacterium lactis]|uniref:alpha/beta fold hydrolase n=1 Tax=Sphingobacterium lactis TaxID=797291 RepID=UPI003F7EDE17
MQQTEKIIKQQDLQIYTQAFGNSSDPCLVLIAGATVSMLFWDESFCSQLADKGLYVIRYDFRDTGQSTSYTAGELNYKIDDLVDDIFLILDSYKINKAHLMGISLGGMLAQIAAMKHPQRINSISLMSSMPWADPIMPTPEMDKAILDFQADASSINWDNENEVLDYMLIGSKLMSGNKPLNVERVKEYILASFRRANNFKSQFNHAQLSGGEEYYNQLHLINCPSLIIHGSEDRICHFYYALSLVQLLKSQNLTILEGTGHELHEADWNIIIDAVAGMILTLENKK